MRAPDRIYVDTVVGRNRVRREIGLGQLRLLDGDQPAGAGSVAD